MMINAYTSIQGNNSVQCITMQRSTESAPHRLGAAHAASIAWDDVLAGNVGEADCCAAGVHDGPKALHHADKAVAAG